MLCVDFVKVPNTGFDCALLGPVADEYLMQVGDQYGLTEEIYLSRAAINSLYESGLTIYDTCEITNRDNVECVIVRGQNSVITIAKDLLADMYYELIER